MEAASIPESPTARPPRPVAKAIADNILWLLLGLALVVYFIQDPKQTLDDVKTGLSNGTIWALIALGYTLVYGIIELINFAHGEVFMIGSFVSVSIWQTLGVTPDNSLIAILGSMLIGIVLAMLCSGTLNVMIERVAYKPLRNAPKLAPLITAIGMSFILQNVGLLWRGRARQLARPHRLPEGLLLGLRRGHRALRRLRRRRHRRRCSIALLWFVGSTPLRQGDARHRAGPRRRAADGHQRGPHDLADLPARRPAGRRGRDDLRALQRHDPVQPGLHRRASSPSPPRSWAASATSRAPSSAASSSA